MAAKNGANNVLVPPDGGEWYFKLTNGDIHKGQLMERFDDAVIIKPEDADLLVIFHREISHMWTTFPKEEPAPGA